MKKRKSPNKRILKAATRFKPYDYSFVLLIEKECFIRMKELLDKDLFVGSKRCAERISLLIRLIDLIDDPYYISYVNVRNAKRFIPEQLNFIYKDESLLNIHVKEEKIWNLYCTCRNYFLRDFWV